VVIMNTRGALGGLILVTILALGGCIQWSDEVSFEPCDGAVEIEPSCVRCVDERCVEARAACAADALCCEDYSCLAACAAGDAACRAGCLDAPGRRTDLIVALDQCRRGECADACVGTGDMSYGWSEACEACMNKGCWKATSDCALNPECEANVVCDAACLDPGCYDGCWYMAEIDGEADNACYDATTLKSIEHPYTEYWGCLYAQCDVECGMGTTWGCVGAYHWPGPGDMEGDVIRFTYHVVDYLNPSQGVEGATVSACNRADIDCALPFSSSPTDADGYACLELPIVDGNGFSGFFRVTHPDYVPIHEQYGRPIFASGGSHIAAVSKAADAVFWESMDLDLDPDRGLVTIGVWDCTWRVAPGVSFELSAADGDTVPFYTGENGNLSFTQTHTSGFGEAAFANVPVGHEPARVVARLAETGEVVGCHEVTIRPGVRVNLTTYPLDAPNFACPGGLP
jgi:hypothetical protein